MVMKVLRTAALLVPLVLVPLVLVPLVLVPLVLAPMVLAHGAVAQDTQHFVSVVDDLPLLVGLTEVGEGVEFATPQGRIAEATASGKLKAQAVLDFYAKTLPQLGWVQNTATRFVREGETLDLVLSEKNGALIVRFSLAPTDQ